MPVRYVLPLGAILAAIAVGLGAYAAHGLDKHLIAAGYEADLTVRLNWFETGVRYQMYHALALLFVGVLASRDNPCLALRFAAAAFVAGIALFSGSLYLMALTSADWRWLGAIVPLGGASFIVGWVVVAYATWKQ